MNQKIGSYSTFGEKLIKQIMNSNNANKTNTVIRANIIEILFIWHFIDWAQRLICTIYTASKDEGEI